MQSGDLIWEHKEIKWFYGYQIVPMSDVKAQKHKTQAQNEENVSFNLANP